MVCRTHSSSAQADFPDTLACGPKECPQLHGFDGLRSNPKLRMSAPTPVVHLFTKMPLGISILV
jgi:hypothetical protein